MSLSVFRVLVLYFVKYNSRAREQNSEAWDEPGQVILYNRGVVTVRAFLIHYVDGTIIVEGGVKRQNFPIHRLHSAEFASNYVEE